MPEIKFDSLIYIIQAMNQQIKDLRAISDEEVTPDEQIFLLDNELVMDELEEVYKGVAKGNANFPSFEQLTPNYRVHSSISAPQMSNQALCYAIQAINRDIKELESVSEDKRTYEDLDILNEWHGALTELREIYTQSTKDITNFPSFEELTGKK